MSNRKNRVFDLIRTYDPVVKKHCSAKSAVAYGVRRDRALLGLPADARPVVFRCRALSRSQRDGLDLVSSMDLRYKTAFRMSLVEVIDHDAARPGSSWKPTRPNSDEALDDDAMDALEFELGFGDKDFKEIGSAILELSTVGKGVPPSCPQLGTSQRAWGSLSYSPPAAPSADDETREE